MIIQNLRFPLIFLQTLEQSSTTMKLSFSLILGLSLLRNIGYGIFSCIFFQALFYKGFIQTDLQKIQVISLLGTTLFSFLWLKTSKFANSSSLLIAYLLKIMSAFIYMHSDNVVFIALGGFLGLLPVAGNHDTFFTKTEQTLLQPCQQENKNIEISTNNEKYLKTFKHIGQVLGSLFAGYYIMKRHNICYKFRDSIYGLTTIYCYICIAELLVFLFLYRITPSISNNDNQTMTKREKPSYFQFMKGFSEASLTNTYLIFLLYQHYPFIQYYKICFILAGKCLLEAITPLLLKLSLCIFRRKLTIGLNYLSHILLFLMMSHHVHVWIQAGAVYILTFVVVSKFDLRQRQYWESQNRGSQEMKGSGETLWRDLGLTAGIAFNYSFILQPTYSKWFFQPFINLGIISILLKVLAYHQLSQTNKIQFVPFESDVQSLSMMKNQNESK